MFINVHCATIRYQTSVFSTSTWHTIINFLSTACFANTDVSQRIICVDMRPRVSRFIQNLFMKLFTICQRAEKWHSVMFSKFIRKFLRPGNTLMSTTIAWNLQEICRFMKNICQRSLIKSHSNLILMNSSPNRPKFSMNPNKKMSQHQKLKSFRRFTLTLCKWIQMT